MNMGTLRSPPSHHLLPLQLLLRWPSFVLCLFFFMGIATAQFIDPAEANALDTIFHRWGLVWYCNTTTSSFDANIISDEYSNGAIITCDCTTSASDGNCHITGLKVYGLDVKGAIPEELQVLKHLKGLNLAVNYLTGPLPAFLANFIEMQYLYLQVNALSGPILKELGNLKSLLVLSISANSFSGTIPPELGGMMSLQELYLDSSGLSGDLPHELSNLKSLNKLWLSDNDFTGNIPDFLGSFTNMTELKMQGNSFQGPIPASFSNLIKMSDLRIGDIISGSSTLHFISNMRFLKSLILRNCKISDALPSDFSQYNNTLYHLDMSFNDISGSIPQSLFNLRRLRYLSLGNNGLSGSLPVEKSSSLTSVDVSYNQLAGTFPWWVLQSDLRLDVCYNQLAGTFPCWVLQSDLQLNLVANNFVIDKFNSSDFFPIGLNCLQNDKPCYRDSPNFTSFAVNCGGSFDVTASDNITYEMDAATSAFYYYRPPNWRKWATSSVGMALGPRDYASYGNIRPWHVVKTSDSELFETSRQSPSSLRYYGLGLKNGHYAVKLQFAETDFIDGPTSASVGRRVFDIYIQGDIKEKDFDIRKEAGGTCFTAVVKEYTAPVTNNFLEIHFFWAGKGTSRVPNGGLYGPSISAISVTRQGPSRTIMAAGLAVGALVILLAIFCLILRHSERKELFKDEIERELHTVYTNVNPDNFSYTEMRTATENFSSSNRLGEGGYGPVFKGKLPDGRIVAVKQLSKTSHQGMHQFLTEIATISTVQHRNLVRLLGYCVEGQKRILVYEFLENKSLDQAIFEKRKLHLDWPKRFGICLGVARGLAYLHQESPVRIVHRDIKASNILLDADLNPKISDFGLAKLADEKKTHVSTKVAGTIGYLSPEYALRGHLTTKVDVYAFGVLCLEILAGRPNSDQRQESDKTYLLEWAWCLHENKRDLELVDGSLSSFEEDEVRRVIGVALLCTQSSPAQRPHMSRVVAMLAGDVEMAEVTTKPSYLDYTSSTSSQLAVAQGQGTTIMSTPSDADSLMNSFLIEGR